MKYNLEQIADICDGVVSGENHDVSSVFIDSRSFHIDGDSLFFAISGSNHNGHNYIGELYRRGVRTFVVEREMNLKNYPKAGFVRVSSSVEALHKLAAHHRVRFKGRVVAVTGSNGKTVVKEWIANLMPTEVKLFRSPKSYNSQVGVPLSLLMLEGDEQLAVIEVGISKVEEMERLSKIVQPEIGIITTIGDTHQEGFDSVRQKIDEKLKLFDSARVIIYNSDYKEIERALKERYPDRELIDAAGQWQAYNFFSDSASQQNAASAMALCQVLGYDRRQISARLPKLQPVAMRLELKQGINDSVIVNDSYNSDINSLKIALDYLFNVSGGRPQTLILSDILQSGYDEEELYRKVAELIKMSTVDRLVGIGERLPLYERLFSVRSEFYPSTEAFIANIKREDITNHAILIKGNRHSQFERISHVIELQSHTTTLEVDLDAMIHNLNVHRALLQPQTRLMAMIKASSYGHGGYEVAATLQHQGVDYLAVAFADEGVLLRERGITMPIVVLNADSDSFELMINNRLEPEIYNFHSLDAFIKALNRYGERAYPIHIKIDTGMHRLGFEPKEMTALGECLLDENDVVRVKTVFSHLAAADSPQHDGFTKMQIENYDKASTALIEILGYRPIRHIANSAGIERFAEAQYDMVRLGIGLYGVGATKEIALRPIGSLRTRIVQIKELAKGETVGYGRDVELGAPTRVATIPIGYADGLNRHLGHGRWSMRIDGKPAPTIGRIAMDTCMIDVTKLNVSEGDVVTIYGDQEGNRVEDMAKVLDTIPYEVMTGISTRVKRTYIKE